MANLVPRDYFGIPTLSDITNDIWAFPQTQLENVSISEDDKNVYVEAAVPGINPEDIDVTYDHGVLWIRGEANQEEQKKKKKFYTKSSSSFSYKVAVPGDISENAEPEAACENGLVMVTFPKTESHTPKKISVKDGKTKTNQKKGE